MQWTGSEHANSHPATASSSILARSTLPDSLRISSHSSALSRSSASQGALVLC